MRGNIPIDDPQGIQVGSLPSAAYLSKYERASLHSSLGIYDPFMLSIFVAPSALQFDNESREAKLRQYDAACHEALRSNVHNIPEQDIRSHAEHVTGFFASTVNVVPSWVQRGHKACEQKLSEMVAYISNEYLAMRAETRVARELRHEFLADALQYTTCFHELSHFVLSCSCSIQCYINWLLWVQAQLMGGLITKCLQSSIAPPKAPLFLEWERWAGKDDPFRLEYRLRQWWHIEQFLGVLAGVSQSSTYEAVSLAAAADFMFRSTVVQFLPGCPPPPKMWGVEVTMPQDACPVLDDGKPYGVSAIHEGYAAVASDMHLGLSYRDLISNIQNPLYHGEYFRLPAYVSQKLRLPHPDLFRYTFLAICDLAMATHMHPCCATRSNKAFSSLWHDLHPGWRFSRIVEFLSKNPDCYIAEATSDYAFFIERLCRHFNWPKPLNVVGMVAGFDTAVAESIPLHILAVKELAFYEKRKQCPEMIANALWLPDETTRLLSSKTVMMFSEDGFVGRQPSADEILIVATSLFIQIMRQYACLSRYTRPEGLPYRHESNVGAIYEFVESKIGCPLEILWHGELRR